VEAAVDAAPDAAAEAKPDAKATDVKEAAEAAVAQTEDLKESPEWKKLMAQRKKPLQTRIAAARPVLTIYGVNGNATKRRIRLPDVMVTPIRSDLVNFVHTQMSKNKRQPYAVMNREGPKGLRAGHQVAAKSWGTGRAVSRVPRVKGGGTHRAGQGAYANMCRGGRIFSPTKVWRKWHRKINKNQRRYAVCSAVAASAVPALVMARGHRIDKVPEIPLVVENDFQKLRKTKAALQTLRSLNLGSELCRCKKRYMRAGKGKMRNRRWRHRLGPLVIFAKDNGISLAVRNIRGVDSCSVYSLNLLKLAPGGHIGRLIVWTEAALFQMSKIFGTATKKAVLKHNYCPPRPRMMNSDLRRIIMSQEIQSVLRPRKTVHETKRKRNPLKVPELMAELNPDFAEEFEKIKAEWDSNPKVARKMPRADTLMKRIRKRRKLDVKRFNEIELKQSDQEEYGEYWQHVFGGDKIFKSAKLLEREKEAVKEALIAVEREKAGLDLLEMLQKRDADDGDDSGVDSEST